jgi:hypothetical protein
VRCKAGRSGTDIYDISVFEGWLIYFHDGWLFSWG